MPLFGTNGIRGVLNETITPELGYRFGMAVGTYYSDSDVALSYDNRTTSHLLKDAVESGLLNTGKNVVDLGMIPTPTAQVYCKHNNVPGAIVTASHNPPKFNGFKVVAKDGSNPGENVVTKIEDLIVGQKFNKVGWEDVGEVRNDDAVGLYLNEILKNVNVPNIKQRHFRVLVDCANGTTVVTTPKLFRRLEVNYVSVNSNADGFFPGRGSEPTEETLKELISFAKSAPFDLSVAHDGDGDRSVFLDEKGEMIDGDKLVALVADHMLELKKGDLVFPVASSFLIDRIAEKHGVKVIRTPVGAPVISEVLTSSKGLMGGEENGKVILPHYLNGGDGGLSVALALDIISSRGMEISSLIRELPDYKLKRIKVLNRSDFERVKTLLKQRYTNMKHDEIDGLRLVEGDSFILTRKSGTEPAIRIYISSTSSDWIKSREKEVLKIIGNPS